MASVDITHLDSLINDHGYPLVEQEYAKTPTHYQDLCEVIPLTDAKLYGDKGQVIIGGNRLEERKDGAGFAMARPEEGYEWQVKVKGYGLSQSYPKRMLEAADANMRIIDLIGTMARTVAAMAPVQKDEAVATLLQKGTLSAGNAAFDGSFPGNQDPNPLLGYDGVPMFSTAHPLKVSASTLSNYLASSALTSANLTAAKLLMGTTSAKDDRGERIFNRASRLVVGSAMVDEGQVLLNSRQLPGSANNDINVHNGTLELYEFPMLDDDADAWWLQSGNIQGLRFYDGGLPEITFYEDQATKTVVFQVEAFWGVNVQDWRGWLAANKASS